MNLKSTLGFTQGSFLEMGKHTGLEDAFQITDGFTKASGQMAYKMDSDGT